MGRKATKAQVVFDEEFVARDFDTTPLTIPNLKGNLYDYEIVLTFLTDSTTIGDFDITFNGDTGSNYRTYYMRADGAVVKGDANDSTNSICRKYFRTNI